MDYIKIAAAFLEGLGIILSPCILPILPIMLSGGAAGGKKRPFGIILGFVVMFSLITLFLREVLNVTGIMPSLIRNISFVILVLFGVIMLIDSLHQRFSQLTQRLASTGSQSSSLNNPNGGFFSGILLGSIVSIVWTPCAGPLLAAVIVQTITSQTNVTSFLVVLAFAIGSAIPMLIITLLGRKAIHKLNVLKTHPRVIRKTLGTVLIISAVLLGTGISTRLFASTLPMAASTHSKPTLVGGLLQPYPAPKIQNIAHWINSKPLVLSKLKGKVVLVDFWTYSCINCIRTIPHLNQLYHDYHQDELVIIGVHSPEFPFEHKLSNVVTAVKNFHILYPVALDNNFATFTNFKNSYWPAHYLINRQGQVVYTHFGEGNNKTLDHNIQLLLGLKAKPQHSQTGPSYNPNQSPETYLGQARHNRYGGTPLLQVNIQRYYFPTVLPQNYWALSGTWRQSSEHLTSAGNASAILLHFNAKHVYIVAGANTNKPLQVEIQLNGQAVSKANSGQDVHNSQVAIKQQRLYRLLSFPKPVAGTLKIYPNQPGLNLYTFTFG